MFRTKDLAVAVLPKGDLPELRKCLLGTRICIRPTILCHRWISCNFLSPCRFTTPCPYLSCRLFSPCGPLTPCGFHTPCGILSPCGQLSPCHQLSPCGHLTCATFISQCGAISPCPDLSGIACELRTQPPGGCIGVTLPDDDPITRVINPEVLVINEVADIKVLREQLTDVVARLGEFEKKGLDFGGETPEELADLETKLKAALEEVQARRKESGKK